MGYIDDFGVKADNKENCKDSLDEASQLFDSLGFTVHPVKSQFDPSNRIIFLGFVLDSIKMELDEEYGFNDYYQSRGISKQELATKTNLIWIWS